MNICVYGASSNEINKSYIEAVEDLGREIASRGHAIVYGGGANGLMGAAARGAFEKHGEIIGVSPSFFNVDGVLFNNCTQLIYTETMRERKQIMEDKADAFIMTPGGIGTFEEFFEILTLKQLKRHNKAIAIFNINGYFDDLLKFMDYTVSEKFMREGCRKLYKTFSDKMQLLDYIENYEAEDFDIVELKNI